MWHQKGAPEYEPKQAKSIVHPFVVKGHTGFTINPYQGCQHRCGYCYATYEWSPEFYDKIYAKSNAAEVLENELKTWKLETIEPVMVSSATDAYQPAELKYNITRRCIEVLQRYGVPYYVFTKSCIISRDLELHKKYKDDCFLVWSITTCNENVRRVVEPGTPPASSIFNVITRFVDAGVCCGVNIDPILPLISDSEEEIDSILDCCARSGVKYVFGAVLRIRHDIWQRMIEILKLLGKENGIDEYKKKIYQFAEPLKHGYNITARESYSKKMLNNLEYKVLKRGMHIEFPDHMKSKRIYPKLSSKRTSGQQQTLMNYI